MQLTITEKAMLADAARNPAGAMHAMEWRSTTAKRGHGSRSAAAICGLVAKGLAEGLVIDSNYEPNIGGFGSTHATEYAARITVKGREAISA